MRIETSRRGFLGGLGATLITAPAIVKAASLMPVRGLIMPLDENLLIHATERVAYSYIDSRAAIALGYAITKKAIDDNLYNNTFGRVAQL